MVLGFGLWYCSTIRGFGLGDSVCNTVEAPIFEVIWRRHFLYQFSQKRLAAFYVAGVTSTECSRGYGKNMQEI